MQTKLKQPKKLSQRSWKAPMHWKRSSPFGIAIYNGNRWEGYIRYFYSKTPDRINSFREYRLCIGTNFKQAQAAMRAVERRAEEWIKKLIADQDNRFIIMFPRKRVIRKHLDLTKLQPLPFGLPADSNDPIREFLDPSLDWR